MLNIVCLKWGTKYGPEYVNRLHSMISRNVTIPYQFVCITDSAKGLHDDIVVKELIPEDKLQGWWYKLTLFKEKVYDLKGEILFLDLDVVITDNLDSLLQHEPNEDFVIIRDWNFRHRVWNSSMFRFKVGTMTYIWDNFMADRDNIIKRLHGDQDWITEQVKETATWPEDEVISYKLSCQARGNLSQKAILPEGAKVVVFHGKPDPEDVKDGTFHRYKHAPWINDHWY